jgi:3-deoxy-manno-octulosonate cytidylyltransferase (CMP-KDO synthetase)
LARGRALFELALTDLLQTSESDGADVWTLKKKITDPHQITSPHICKVVSDAEGFALYFSRQPIPYIRDTNVSPDFFKHIGIYAFSDRALQKLATLTPSPLEIAEQLEQLRFLHHGLRVRIHETLEEPFGIDLPEHLSLATTKLTESNVNT